MTLLPHDYERSLTGTPRFNIFWGRFLGLCMIMRRCTLTLLAVLAATAAGGCSRDYYADDADQQAYGILHSAHLKEMGYQRDFTIDDGPSRNVGLTAHQIIGDLPIAPPPPAWIAQDTLDDAKQAFSRFEFASAMRLATQWLVRRSRDQAKGPMREMDLPAVLRIARRNSRDFQTRKETVYVAALALTTQEHAFEWQYGFTGSVNRTVEGAGRDRSIGTSADLSFTRDLVTGAAVALDIGLTGLKYLNHELGTTLQNALSLTVTQPLWGGSDPTVVMNNLIQARRNVIYALRTFARHEKEFSVSVASSYYNVLLQLDRVKNQWENYRNLTAARQRNELLAAAGRLRILELNQARQSELQAQNAYLTAVQAYERQLDAFRVLIGLPVDAPVLPSRRDLEAISAEGIRTIDVDLDRAVRVALARRLDLKNTRGAAEDADREVIVAADALKGEVNFVGGINVASMPDTRAGRFMFHQGTYEFGLDVDLPLERLAERNAFRTSLINYDATVRDYMDLVDQIKGHIRESLRDLKRTEQTYRISVDGVALATSRVEGTRLEMDAGRATTRDLLESQDDLVNAQNDRTQALVSHLITRLEFQRDMELLEVDAKGQIHEADINLILDAAGEPDDAEADGR